MKYIKLYEDFSDKILYNLEDIKWIIVSFCDDRISYKLLTNFEDKLVVYSLSCEQTNQEEFESLEGRIKDLNKNYEYVVTNNKIVIGLPEYLKIFKEIDKYQIENYTFNDDYSIDVDGNVNLYDKGLTILPIKFRNVSGYFSCSYNKLTSLVGGPKTIGGGFYCYDNNLTSLEGDPGTVGGDFHCYNNKLTSLKGGPKEVGGNFVCSSNKLVSLEGSPETVGGAFYCYENKLTSLEGGPKTVGGDFNCHHNMLTSLDGIGEVKGKVFSKFTT